MSSSPPVNLPVALRTARRRLDRWRSRQPKRTRLPADLWQKAVRLAQEHGLNRTATALGLKYESLKKHLEAAGTPERLDSASVRPTFIELLPGGLTALRPECTIEWANEGGTTIRMHVRGIGVDDLVVLARDCRDGRA